LATEVSGSSAGLQRAGKSCLIIHCGLKPMKVWN
jgi:hypothetical protein